MGTKASDVEVKDLQHMSSRTGSMHRLKTSEDKPEVMTGEFLFRDFGQGLSMHASDVTELQDMQNSVELQPCLSFNLIFTGEVEFFLGDERHRIGVSEGANKVVQCSAISLNHSEIMTRYLFKDRKVRKLNISISQSWLKSRCKTSLALRDFSRLFGRHKQVCQWQASEELVQLAEALMKFKTTPSLSHELLMEQQAIQLVGSCVESLLNNLTGETEEQVSQLSDVSAADKQLKVLIDEHISSGSSLAEIAEASSMSVSTLQRRFKKNFNMTVNEYIRLRRLDLAKTAITLEGLSIGEAAYIAGYNHSSNFIAAFKKQFAMTPAELMKVHRGGGE